MYDGKNTVYVDANADRARVFSGLLGHEMWHKMFKSGKARRIMMQAYNKLDKAERNRIVEAYTADSEKRGFDKKRIKEINREEVAAAYAEELFNDPEVWDFILSEEASLADRTLKFFEKAEKRYSFAEGMPKAARKWLAKYKMLFDQVAAYNKRRSAAQNTVASDTVRKIERIGKVVESNAIEPNTNKNGSYGNENGVSNNVRTTADNKKVVSDSGERYALKHIPKTDINYVSITINDIVGEGIDPSDSWGRKARIYLKKKFRGVILPVGKTKTTYIRSEGINEYTNPAKEIDDDIYRQKMLAATELDNLLKAGKYIGWSRDDGRHPDVLRWMNYETNFLVEDSSGNKQVLKGIIRIKRISRGDCFYDITKIENITLGNIGQNIINYAAKSESDAFNNSIPDSAKKSNSFDEKTSKNVDDGSRSALKKSDKEYRDEVKAKADEKVAKATAKAEAKYEKKTETAKAKLRAEYETDTTFSEASVKKSFDSVEAISKLKKARLEANARLRISYGIL